MSPTPTALEEALAENARLRSQVQRLEEMVARLEARLNQNSQNSSKPPSTDHPDSYALGYLVERRAELVVAIAQ